MVAPPMPDASPGLVRVSLLRPSLLLHGTRSYSLAKIRLITRANRRNTMIARHFDTALPRLTVRDVHFVTLRREE